MTHNTHDKSNDFSIQQALDDKLPVDDSDRDVRVYRRLFEVMGREDGKARLSTSFAYQVMVRVVSVNLGKQESSATLTSVGISFSALVLGLCAAYLLSALGYGASETLWNIGNLISQLPLTAIYIVACVGLLGLSDLVVVRRQSV